MFAMSSFVNRSAQLVSNPPSTCSQPLLATPAPTTLGPRSPIMGSALPWWRNRGCIWRGVVFCTPQDAVLPQAPRRAARFDLKSPAWAVLRAVAVHTADSPSRCRLVEQSPGACSLTLELSPQCEERDGVVALRLAGHANDANDADTVEATRWLRATARCTRAGTQRHRVGDAAPTGRASCALCVHQYV
jgi:hypothetical protein